MFSLIADLSGLIASISTPVSPERQENSSLASHYRQRLSNKQAAYDPHCTKFNYSDKFSRELIYMAGTAASVSRHETNLNKDVIGSSLLQQAWSLTAAKNGNQPPSPAFVKFPFPAISALRSHHLRSNVQNKAFFDLIT